jgi:hypothetical protein
MNSKFNYKRENLLSRGQLLVQVIVFSTIAIIIIGGLVGWAGTNIKASRLSLERERSIQLAEAGIDYYRWHLAHAQTDYQDGTGVPGPYVHDVLDKDGDVAGQFSLVVTPPIVGSTKVRIESTGIPINNPQIGRKITVEFAIPSLAKYAVVANDNMRFGLGTEIFGPVHSNGGIRFDGLTHNIMTSSLATYNDPDHVGAVEFGVHTHVNPPPGSGTTDPFRPLEAPPTNPVQSRPDVFEIGRQFPVPAEDFVGLTSNLAQIKADAQASGRYLASSGSQGYQIILKTNDTFDVYRVTSQINQSGCTNSQSQSGWGTWSINNRVFVANYAIPANGLVFVEDNAWVQGTINSARVTIAAGRFPDNPSNRPNIIVNNDLLYTNYDGQDVIGLISQGHVHVGLVSDTDLRIDAALVAQNGRVGRFYYPPPGGGNNCGPYHVRNSITLYGMIATNIRYGFAYTNGNGYQIRNINYDANLLYGPPPTFPLTGDQYQIISWEEVR